ncbi:MAG: FHA domain-containing protein [Rubripirellula sp.]
MPWPESVKSAEANQYTEERTIDSKDSSARAISIGRGPDNDVVLSDSNVSTNHARLIIGGGEIVLDDLGSTNGTSIGNVENKISRGIVQPADTVFFGSTSYCVSDLINQSEPAHVAPKIQLKNYVRPKLSGSGGMSLAVAGIGALLLLLIGVGWYVTRKPNAAEVVQGDTPSSVPNTTDPAVVTDMVKATPKGAQENLAAADPIEGSLSPEENIARSVFLVICTDVQRETPFRVGTGFAVDAKTVVTSASVIQAMRSLQRNGFPEAFLFSPSSERELKIVSTVIHPQFEKADKTARQAQQTHDAIYDQLESAPPQPEAFEAVKDRLIAASTEALEAMDQKATYDVAVINTTESLDHWLPEVSDTSKLRPKQKISVTGYAYDVEDPFFDRDAPVALLKMSSRIAQLITGPKSSAGRMVASGTPEQDEYAYLGSPVLNTQGQVVGVYSRPTPPVAGSVAGSVDEPRRSFDAALFTRVQECRNPQQSH